LVYNYAGFAVRPDFKVFQPGEKPDRALQVHGNRLTVTFPEGWLAAHPLTRADLEVEAQALDRAGFRLNYA
ncbi:MAG: hypothetical protein R6V11_02010, partial [Ectothiorhodospiraceae bacterium]